MAHFEVSDIKDILAGYAESEGEKGNGARR